ncbi:MAG: Holliday junction resolvase RuvX [Deltaproteobacteria bacterium]|nr:Holliday junction resolvase RuvX [Deltaproteobacteria bacterium]
MRRLLGLDVGTVRIGVALSDPLGIAAHPYEVIDRRSVDPVKRIVAIIDAQDVERLIVGRPLRLSGEAGPAVAAVEAFVAELAKAVTLPIELWDERLSTAQAQREMIAGGARREHRRQSIDKIAAALILQSYLDAKSSQL